MHFCERCQRSYQSASTLRRHRRQIHRENLANLPPGRVRPSAERAREASVRREQRRRGNQLLQRRLTRAQMYGERRSLEQLVEQMERLVADYLVGLPRPTPETSFWYLGHLLERADLSPHDVGVFPFGAQLQRLQRPPAVIPMSLRQTQHNADAVAFAEQMLSRRPGLIRRFEFLFVAFCACSAQQ